jgi:hypothetical protein
MLNNLKIMLGIDATDTDLDAKLNLILSNTTARLKILLGGMEPPEELSHIIVDVAVVRFNRIGSEGLSSHSVEGESMNFASSDFDGYMDEITAFLEASKEAKRGKVRFL